MMPKGGKDKAIFDSILNYLKATADYDSPFVRAFCAKYGYSIEELKKWVNNDYALPDKTL